MVKFTEIIDGSIEWAAAVLFRPFRPKKWLILGFVALLAGHMAGANFNLGSNYGRKKKEQAETQKLSQVPGSIPAEEKVGEQSFPTFREVLKAAFPQANPALIIAVAAIVIVVFLAIMVVMIWLYSRFSFVFIEDVIKNDASIKRPFKVNKKLGDSLFLFSLAFAAISFVLSGLLIFVCIYSLIRIGVFDKTQVVGFKQIFLTCLPYGLLFLLLIFISLIISRINTDFVLVCMFKDKIKIMKAWAKTLTIISSHKKDVIKYLFIKLGLSICAGIISGIVSLIGAIGLLFPIGILAAIFYLIYSILPQALQPLYAIILFIAITPVALFLWYCFSCLSLPFGVFFRSLSIKFMGRLDPRYNLFRYAIERS